MATQNQRFSLGAWLASATWLQFSVLFTFIPMFSRWAFQFLIAPIIINLFGLRDLTGQRVDYQHYVNGMADYYGRWMFNVVFIILIAIALIYVFMRENPRFKAWGLHWNRIIPGILYFVGFWAITYFVFIPLGSLFTGGESYYLGIPTPPGVQNPGIHNYSSFGELILNMLSPKFFWAFAGSAPNTAVAGNNFMGFMDFLRIWVLNAPIIVISTVGYFFNKFMSMFGTNDVDDTHTHSNLRILVASFFAALFVPLYQFFYRWIDAKLSVQAVNVSGAEIQQTVYALHVPSLVWTLAFWFVIALFFNLAFLWVAIEKSKKPVSDWAQSLSKWLPGFIVFIVGLGISLLSGWHLGVVTETAVIGQGLFGPFTNYLGIFLYTSICIWIYFRTRNLIIPILVFASLPWFLNFIQTSPNAAPGLYGTLAAMAIVLVMLYFYTEGYRLWSPYLTFDVVYEKIEEEKTPELSETPPEDKQG